MYKSVLLASILYISFVYERGYPTARRFNFSLRKRLLLLVELWRKVIERLRVREFEQADIDVFNHFLELYEQNPKMMSGYNYLYKKINALKLDGYKGIGDYKAADFENRYREKLLRRIDDVIDELSGILAVKRLFLPKLKLGQLINSLHNLPRAFLLRGQPDKDVPNNIEDCAGIGFKTALKYAGILEEEPVNIEDIPEGMPLGIAKRFPALITIDKATDAFVKGEDIAVYCPDCNTPLVVNDVPAVGSIWVYCEKNCSPYRISSYSKRPPLREDGKLGQVMDGKGEEK